MDPVPSLEVAAPHKRPRSRKRELPDTQRAPPVQPKPASTSLSKRKRFKPPSASFKRLDPASAATVPSPNLCAFCHVPGTQRECEGQLLGPLKHVLPNAKRVAIVWVHRNCATWAPEVWQDEKSAKLQGVSAALLRANRSKCALCGGRGASLSCMFRSTKCCRPMHFRCALLAGAALIMSVDGFQTLCPLHAKNGVNGEAEPPSRDMLHEQTPLDPKLLRIGSLCTICSGDNYDPTKGAILNCAKCGSRQHTKCIYPGIEYDGVFAIASSRGDYFCKSCMHCVSCVLPISDFEDTVASSGVSADSLVVLGDHTKEACIQATTNMAKQTAVVDGLVACVACDHFTIHAACMPDHATRETWRCDRCLVCRHCGAYDLSWAEWDEEREACQSCMKEFANGGTVCPVCRKVYREGENVPMVQCDSCDRWLHAESCSGLSTEKFTCLGETAAKYVCPPCHVERKSKSASKRKPKARARSSGANEEAQGSVGRDTGNGVRLETDKWACGEEDGLAFIVLRKPGSVPEPSSQANVDLAPNADICRACGSGGIEHDFRFCADCGEAFHGFCLESRLPSREPGKTVTVSTGTTHRLSAGALGPSARPWRCARCSICVTCGHGGTETLIILCDHCDRGYHLNCLAPPLETAPAGSFTCRDCRRCELCQIQAEEPTRIGDLIFCTRCARTITEVNACSVCDQRYPAMPTGLGSGSGPDVCSSKLNGASDQHDFGIPLRNGLIPDGGESVTVPSAITCDICCALVHVVCDPSRLSSNIDGQYVCPPCRGRSGAQTMSRREAFNKDQASKRAPARFVQDVVSRNSSGLREEQLSSRNMSTVGSDNEHYSFPDGLIVDEAVTDQRVNLTPSPKILCPEDDLLFTTDHHRATVVCDDARVCEFCHRLENLLLPEGRMIPWASDSASGGPHCWIHVACVLWSRGVTIFDGGPDRDILGGSRKAILGLAKRSECSACLLRGASLCCSAKDCTAAFHFHCGVQSDVGCVVGIHSSEVEHLNTKLRDCSVIRLKDIKFLDLLCSAHAAGKETLPLLSAHKLFDLSHSLRIFSMEQIGAGNGGRKKDTAVGEHTSVRVGALSVFQLGRLVPNSIDFLRDGALIPAGFRAARRYWSLKSPGQRCLYFCEVRGDADTGPMFVVRCADAPAVVIQSTSINDVWLTVTRAVKEARSAAGMCGKAFGSFQLTGLQAFGFARCRPVVTLVEALPMASLFKSRYTFLFRKPSGDGDAPFLSSSISPPAPRGVAENLSGSARSEGYVPMIHLESLRKSRADVSDVPTYENVPSGEAFQFSVAMEAHNAKKATGFAGDFGWSGRGSRLPRFGSMPGSQANALTRVGKRNVNPDERSGKGKNATQLLTTIRYRLMCSTWKTRTAVLRSRIAGWGVFATEDIGAHEMIIEYVGEIIRPSVSDLRERLYDGKGLGCYMFHVEPGKIVDATMAGNSARYINHSCDANCKSRTITVENGRRTIVIFSKREIRRGEELCYDYCFPFDEADRVRCGCGSARCKGWMN